MTSQTYPSGLTVKTDYDEAGRVAGVKQAAGGYFTGVGPSHPDRLAYSPHGAVTSRLLGNGLWEHVEFNSRLQAEEIRLWNGSTNLLALNYGYGSANNNGNVLSQQIAMPGLSLMQNYAYDTLNRLETASETGSWSQTYGYDRYGNRWVAAGGQYGNDPALTPAAQTDFDASTNRLAGATYDDAGNLTADAAGRTFDYDAENRQIAFEGGLAQYFYDGEGRRVKKQAGAEVTIYVYNILGQLVAEYGTAANPESGTRYLSTDHLGSTRVVTDETDGVLSRYDYLPFGEEIAGVYGDRNTVIGYGSADTLNHKFTGKERDAESGLDYFGARYFVSPVGRFMSPDPLLNSGKPWKPQSWNRYTYVLNNPLRYTDPFGLYEWDKNCKDDDKACQENRQNFREAVAQLRTGLGQAKEGSKEYNAIKKVLDRIGTEGDKNRVRVAFSSELEVFGKTDPTFTGKIKMTFNFELLQNQLSEAGWRGDDIGIARASLVAHEGTHASEGLRRSIVWLFSRQERANFEGRAFNTESLFYKAINRYEPFGPLWNPAWVEADREKVEQKRREAVERHTESLYGRNPEIQY